MQPRVTLKSLLNTSYHFEGSGFNISTMSNNILLARDQDSILDAYDQKLELAYKERSLDQAELLIDSCIYFGFMVVITSLTVILYYLIKTTIFSRVKNHKNKTKQRDQVDEWSPNAVVKIPLDSKSHKGIQDIMDSGPVPRLQVLSDISKEASSDSILRRRDYKWDDLGSEMSKLSSTALMRRYQDWGSDLRNSQRIVEEKENCLSKSFNTHEPAIPFQLTGEDDNYSLKDMILLRPYPSPLGIPLNDGEEGRLDFDKTYTKDDILLELTKSRHLTSVLTKFKTHWKAELIIQEIQQELMQHPSESIFIRFPNNATKPIAAVKLSGISLNCLQFKNPNIFLNSYTKLMSSIIESGAMIDLFEIEEIGGLFVLMILEFIYCHWYFLEEDTSEIEKRFHKWEAPFVVQQRFYLFKYLLTLKISGVQNKILDRFLLHLEFESSFTPLINQAIKITEDTELLHLLFYLKRKCNKGSGIRSGYSSFSPSTDQIVLRQKGSSMPGSFSGW